MGHLELVSSEWRAVVEQLADAVLTMDDAHRICAMNAAAERLFGRSLASLKGHPIEELMPARFRGTHAAQVDAFATGGEPARHLDGARLVTALRADGTEVTLEATASRTTVDGETRLCIVMRDVSTRLRLEREVEQFERRLARVARLEALSSFSAGIAHDFNNTLAVVLSLTRTVIDELDPEDPRAADLGEVVKAAQRGSDLVRRILALGSGPVGLVEEVDPATTLEDLGKVCASTAPANVAVRVELEPTPAVVTDESLFSQALLNLVTNALYAMRERGGTLTLALSARVAEEPLVCTTRTLPPGHYVRVAVSDTGGGLPAEVLAHLFEPFFTTKPTGVGSGLGLAMVYGLVSRSHGAVHVTSERGQGTTFELYLPAGGAAVAPIPTPLPRPAPRGRYRLLLVDRDLFVGAALRRALMARGHSCHAVSEARDALALLKADPAAFDALVCDEELPELPGRALALAARKTSPQLRVFLMSGCPEAPAGGEVERVLAKPVTAEALCLALDATG